MNPIANGTMGVHPQTSSIPRDLSKEQIQVMYTKWRDMKAQGINESNPEFARISSVLRHVQQKSVYKAQQQAQQPGVQHSQSPRPQQPVNQNSILPVNGRPVVQSIHQQTQMGAPASPRQRPSNELTLPPASGAVTAPSVPPQKANHPPNNTFTPDQLAILRHQIMAFKMISKNIAVPAHIQTAIFTAYQKTLAMSSGEIAAVNATLEAAKDSSKADESGEKTRSGYETFTSPWTSLQSSISFHDHGSRDKRLMIPSIMPSGIDVGKLQEERERIIYNRVSARKAELEKLPSNLAEYDASKRFDNISDSLRLKALIEYKALGLLSRQRAMRQEIVSSLIHSDSLAVTSNRSMFRRMKKQSLREARITEKLEKQQRDQREQREKRKHVEYIQGIISHGQKVKENAKASEAKAQKLGRMMMQHHVLMEKEEQKRMERTAKQRLQALKANDEEAYLKLLDQAKDTRITHLLRQTDQFLESLAASVRQQQRDAVKTYGEPEGYQEPESDEEDDEKVDYYAVAHRIQETISEQPAMLTGGKLKDYQLKGLQWMISLYNNNLNGILADEMGLGKTIQTISLITYLIEKKKQNGPFLVIVPLSTLTNWNLEFEKWAPTVGKIVYKGPPTARKQQQSQIKYNQWHVLLTTYEYIIKDRPLLSKIKWNYMIIDEGHRMKNSQSKLSATLTTYYNCRYRLILTGTPLQNNLPELWALLNFVLPTIFKSVKSFDEWFNTPFANTGGQDRMELSEEEALLVIRRLHKVLRPFLLRRLKKDVEAELPDKVEKVIKCKFSALQSRLYSQMMNNGILYVNDADKGGKTGVKGLSNMIMQLRKLCNHPFVFEEVESAINPRKGNNDTLWRTAGKFELLDRLLPKFFHTGHRVLMFFQMTQIMNIMEDFLHLRGFKYLRLDGSTKADDRSLLLKKFNAPESPYFIFLLSTRAGGLGLNLQTADTVIIYDSDWNPHQDLQAQDRAHRIGQKNEVRILRLITSNSVEERILERAQYKLDIDGKVIQAGKFDNKSTNEERDALLRVMLEAEEKDAGDNEELDDDELNEIIARNDNELEFFKKLDQERDDDPMYGKGGKLERLMVESELPAIYLQDDIVPIDEPTGPVGRGARERKVTNYDDGLTEEQWLDAIDNDEDTVEDAAKRKRDRIERRQVNKAKRTGVYESSPLPESPGADETPPAQKRKRGRKPAAEKRRVEEVEEPKSRKRQRVSKGGYIPSDGLSPGNRAVLQRGCETIFDAVKNLEDPENERLRSEIFEKLPSKKIFPDYYHIIKQPISFNEIKKRMRNGDYMDLDQFQADFKLMFNNARTYNEEGSIVYEDANAMDAEFEIRFAEEKKNYDALTNNDNRSSLGDGTSTGQISSATTPAPSTPHIRLKVKNSTATPNDGDLDDSD
ncbi:transcriptional regulator [Rhizina undulata]